MLKKESVSAGKRTMKLEKREKESKLFRIYM